MPLEGHLQKISALLVCCLAAFALALAASAQPAFATSTVAHPFLSSFDGSDTPEGSIAIEAPRRLGIDEATGRVYQGDPRTGAINIFDADGQYLSRITRLASGSPSYPSDPEKLRLGGPVAVDNSGTASDGRIYAPIVDNSGLVYVFDSSGKYLSTIDGSTTPSGYFSTANLDLTVDDAGNLYIGDPFNSVVVKYDNTGDYLSQIPVDGGVGAIAVDSNGNVYATPFDRTRVDKFGPGGNLISTMSEEDSTGIAVDRSNDHVFISSVGFITELDENGNFVSRFAVNRPPGTWDAPIVNSSTGRIYSPSANHVDIYAPGTSATAPDVTIAPATDASFFEATVHGTIDPLGSTSSYFFQYRPQGTQRWEASDPEDAGSGTGATPVAEELSGLKSNTTYEVRLVGINSADEATSTSSVETFETTVAPVPVATIDPVDGVTATSAHFAGTFNPEGAPATARFEYRTEFGGWTKLPPHGPSDGTSPIAIEDEAKGLTPSTTYFVRLVAENPGASGESAELSFTTPAQAPFAYSGGAAPRTQTTARLNGWVTPRNNPTTYYFEFGPTPSYGTSLPASQDAEAGSGMQQINVSAQLENLEPGTTYHFRLVAENLGGKTVGPDREFRTRTPAETGPLPRGIELVNNPDKGNQSVAFMSVNASPDASKILWSTNGGAPGGPTGSGSVFLAERGPTGWHSRSLLPPAEQLVDKGGSRYQPEAANADFDKFLFTVSSGVFTDPIKTLVAMDDATNQRVLGSAGRPESGQTFVRGNDDFTHAYANTVDYLDPAHHPAGTQQIYDLAVSPPELASATADGDGFQCGVVLESGLMQWATEANGYEWISTDPSAPARTYFETQGDEKPCPSRNLLYLRDLDANTTTLISGPALPGGPQSQAAQFVRASDDGSEVIFVAESRLAADDTNDSGDIYKYTVGEGRECLTCEREGAGISVFASNARPYVAASNDLSFVYFTAPRQLVDGVGPEGGLYVWHDGEIRFVGSMGNVFQPISTRQTEMVDGGRVLFFRSDDPQLAGDDLNGTTQFYRYDFDDQSVECVTCNRLKPPTETPTISSAERPGGVGASTATGDTFVFLTTEAIDPRDVNTAVDVYEWRNGGIRMVTDGLTQWPAPVEIIGLGSDGKNLIFRAPANLTGYERDNTKQLYVAREGGGFPRPPVPPAPCGDESCQGPLQAAPPGSSPTSSGYGGPGNARESESAPKQKKKKPRCSKKAKRRGGKCVSKKRKHRSDNGKQQGNKRRGK